MKHSVSWPLEEPIAGIIARTKVANGLLLYGSIESLQYSIAQLNAINKRAPGYARTDLNLAKLLSQTGQWEAASVYFARYFRLHRPAEPNTCRLWLDTIMMLGEAHKPEALAQAAQHLQWAVTVSPGSPMLYVQLARALQEAGKVEDAREALLAGATVCQNILLDRPEESLLEYSVPVYEAWLMMDFLYGEPGALIKPVGLQLIEQDAQGIRLAYLLGEYHRRLGNRDEMLEAFGRVQAACQMILGGQDNIEAMELLAQTYQHVDVNPDIVRLLCRRMLELQPTNQIAARILANLKEESSGPGSAEERP